jgi:type I restriction enzyme S subunit
MGSFNEVLLGDLCTFTQGVQIADKDTVKTHQEGYIRYIYIRDLFTDKYPVYVKDEYPKKILNWGDIVMVNTGNTSGYVYRAKEGVLCNNAFKISVQENKNELLDKEFLWVYLNSSAREQMLKRLFNPAGQPHVGHKNVARLKLKLPPLPEQRKIAQILSTWDKAIATTEKLIDTSKQQKKALMQQLLTGKKRLINPETGKAFDSEWENYTLSKVCKITKGKQLNRSTLKPMGKYPVINGGITPSGYTDSFNTKRNTITISEGGNSCGYIDFQKVDFWCGGHCYNLHEVTVDAEYLYQYLKFSERRIMSLRVGSGLPNIQKKAIESVPVLSPSKLEQQRIASVLTASDKEIELLEAKLAHLKQEKKALMQQLLTGKRRVKVDEVA